MINNFDALRHVFRYAMAGGSQTNTLGLETISEKQFFIPHSTLFTFDSTSKVQTEFKKNVYGGYLSSAEVRSKRGYRHFLTEEMRSVAEVPQKTQPTRRFCSSGQIKYGAFNLHRKIQR